MQTPAQQAEKTARRAYVSQMSSVGPPPNDHNHQDKGQSGTNQTLRDAKTLISQKLIRQTSPACNLQGAPHCIAQMNAPVGLEKYSVTCDSTSIPQCDAVLSSLPERRFTNAALPMGLQKTDTRIKFDST